MTLSPVRARALPRPRDALGEFGLYVHVPFCAHRCWYCDFNTYEGKEHLADRYMSALARDAAEAISAPAGADLAERPVVTSVFIGGGTPTLVDPAHIAALLRAVRAGWTLDPGAEVTIECNPENVDERKLSSYLDAGVNRASFGVQSLDDRLLERLGRTHDAATALAALRAARRVGFDNVSADLIFGVPGETDAAWRRSVEGVLAQGPVHVSAYALTYEEGTPLDAWRRSGRVRPEPEDAVAARWELADRLLTAAGLERYETSNWAQPGRRSRHNGLYWATGEYLGVGAGAHSHLATATTASRSWTVRGIEEYVARVERGTTTVAGGEEIDRDIRSSEVMMLGLRRTGGVRARDFEALTGAPLAGTFADALAEGVRRGLLAWDGRCARVVRPLLGDAAGVLFA